MQHDLLGSTFDLKWPWPEVKYWPELLRSPCRGEWGRCQGFRKTLHKEYGTNPYILGFYPYIEHFSVWINAICGWRWHEFLTNNFFLKVCKGATYPMGWFRCPGMVLTYWTGNEPKARSGCLFAGLNWACQAHSGLSGSGLARNKHKMPGFMRHWKMLSRLITGATRFWAVHVQAWV